MRRGEVRWYTFRAPDKRRCVEPALRGAAARSDPGGDPQDLAGLTEVGTLFERIEAQSTNPEGRKAIELLGRRGLTDPVREQAKKLLADLKRTDAPIIPTIDPDSLKEQARAIDKAWA